MVSNGGADVGASKITGELLDIVIRMPQAMEQLTGVDITKVRLSLLCTRYVFMNNFIQT